MLYDPGPLTLLDPAELLAPIPDPDLALDLARQLADVAGADAVMSGAVDAMAGALAGADLTALDVALAQALDVHYAHAGIAPGALAVDDGDADQLTHELERLGASLPAEDASTIGTSGDRSLDRVTRTDGGPTDAGELATLAEQVLELLLPRLAQAGVVVGPGGVLGGGDGSTLSPEEDRDVRQAASRAAILAVLARDPSHPVGRFMEANPGDWDRGAREYGIPY